MVLLEMLAVGLFCGAVCGYIQLVFVLRGMARPERNFSEVPLGKFMLMEEPAYRDQLTWAQGHGFIANSIIERHGRNLFGKTRISIGVWRSEKEKISLEVFAVGEGFLFEFTTEFEGGESLVTCNSASIHILPMVPGHYRQSFESTDPTALLDRHRAAVVYLGEHMGLHVLWSGQSYLEVIFVAQRTRADYFRPFFLWALRITPRMFGFQLIAHGKSVMEQYPIGTKETMP